MYALVDVELVKQLTAETVEYIKKTMVIVMKGPGLFNAFSLKQLLFIIHERAIDIKVYVKYISVDGEDDIPLIQADDDEDYQVRRAIKIKHVKDRSHYESISMKTMREGVAAKVRMDHLSDPQGGYVINVSIISIKCSPVYVVQRTSQTWRSEHYQIWQGQLSCTLETWTM